MSRSESSRSGTENSDEESSQQYHKFRKALSSPMIDRNKVSIWSILRQCVDKELYRFTIPVIWNEPLSLLQRMAENMRYVDDLLDKGATSPNPIDRMKYVASYFISSTSIHACRISKPFNPLLGETYEYVSSDNFFRICCEQVSHHPPISAYYSESIKLTKSGPKWKYYGSVDPQMKLNILNACVEAYPEGIQTVEFPEWDETYTWHNLKISAHNLVLGKLWFEPTGRAEIINHKLNIRCVLDFKPYSWFKGQLYRVEGYILDSNDNKVTLLNGKWDEYFYATNNVDKLNEFNKATEKLIEKNADRAKRKSKSGTIVDDIELLWKAKKSLKIMPEFYNFTKFTLTLNEMYEELKKSFVFELNNGELSQLVSLGPLPPTDSRYRPDMRHLEDGQPDLASSEKTRLEEKQREISRKRESGELPKWAPVWFMKKSHHAVKEEETWTFTDKYWQRDFSQSPDIF